MPPGPPRSRRPRWRRPALALAALAGVLVVAAVVVPFAMVAAGTRRATACLALIEAPRGPALPDCNREVRWFVQPSHLAWTRHPATYRAEELGARAALAAYTDAAVGRPDPEALERATGALAEAERTVAEGSRRLSFEELGPSAPAPRLGRVAAGLGDRRTLLARPDRWIDWHVRVHALRAALTEGDVARAVQIAGRYAAFDPRDEDLRTTVAALLCLGPDAGRGVAMLTFTQDDRASRRYAAMARNWGDVRAVIVACAVRAGVAPPPRPDSPQGGDDDAVEARTVQAARLAAMNGDEDRARRAAEVARDLLASSVRQPEARLGLLATALNGGVILEPAAAAELARPRDEEGEPPLSPGPLLAMDWLPPPGIRRPLVPGRTLAAAAERAAALAARRGLAEEDGAPLRAAAVALAFEAARELALEGDAAVAVDVLDRHGAGAGEPALALARSSAWWVSGEPGRALDALGDPGRFASVSVPARAAMHLQRAELLASLGRRAEAAAAAVAAEEAMAGAEGRPPPAPSTGVAPPIHPFPVLATRARWTRLALARPPHGTPLRDGAEVQAARPIDGEDGYPWPWVGFADPSARWARRDQPALSIALARWEAARAAPPDERRALRYAALQRRGDAPPALIAYLVTAGELLGEGEGDVEVWLDAFFATDAQRFSYRQLLFARAEAARWRGDTASAALWRKRYEALQAVAADPRQAEIARYLGI